MRGLRRKWRNPVLNKIGSLKTWNVFSGCLCVGRDGGLKVQSETFAKPKGSLKFKMERRRLVAK